ncbi:MAG: hypothetical protein JEZ06_23835 [Anaerolineaceae bacterium]|nr:hypothetical protein [Anaerolineaceae bacterium]
MSRQDPFSSLKGNYESSHDQGKKPNGQYPASILDQIPIKTSRSRDWEKRHHTKTYRGISVSLQTKLKHLALELGVPVSDLARAFFEFGIQSLNENKLNLDPKPSGQHMTLYPFEGYEGSAENLTPSPANTKKTFKMSSPKDAWRSIVSYRIPPELHFQIKSISQKKTVPVGELACVLLKYGLEKYETGTLNLVAQPKKQLNSNW